MPTLRSIGDTFLQLFNEVLLYIPKVISAAIVLIIGYFIAKIVRTLLTKALRALKFDQMCDRAGISGMLQKAGSKMDAAGLLGLVVFWWIFLMFIENALNSLALPSVTAYINIVLAYLPRVFAALLIVIVGALIANVVAGIVRGTLSEAKISSAGMLASLARWAILLFAVLSALTELDIAPNMVFILFACTAGMIALAGALAFGLGGRDTAAQIVSGWYSKGQQAAPQLAQAASKNAKNGQSNGQKAQTGDAKAPQTIEFTAGEAASADKYPR